MKPLSKKISCDKSFFVCSNLLLWPLCNKAMVLCPSVVPFAFNFTRIATFILAQIIKCF